MTEPKNDPTAGEEVAGRDVLAAQFWLRIDTGNLAEDKEIAYARADVMVTALTEAGFRIVRDDAAGMVTISVETASYGGLAINYVLGDLDDEADRAPYINARSEFLAAIDAAAAGPIDDERRYRELQEKSIDTRLSTEEVTELDYLRSTAAQRRSAMQAAAAPDTGEEGETT
jgi:hypothetical protein